MVLPVGSRIRIRPDSGVLVESGFQNKVGSGLNIKIQNLSKVKSFFQYSLTNVIMKHNFVDFYIKRKIEFY